jgi:hypothetical protein
MAKTALKAIVFCLGLGLIGTGSGLAESWELRPMDKVVGSDQIRAGRVDEALRLLKQAKDKSGGGDIAILGNLCVAHALKMHYSTALRYCSQAIANPDAGPTVYNNRGVVRAVIGDGRGAFRDFRQASCKLVCQPDCPGEGDSARAVAQRNLDRLKRSYTALYAEELRFQATL